MIDTLRHRGPDDEGYFLVPGAGLGHCRLSIIDLQTGHQPMTNEDGSLWIIFNGEIYNYVELRKQLGNHHFKTQSDTEVILHGYEEYGLEILDKLEGMFAFCIYNVTTHEAVFARDPFGIKPLYYTILKNQFIFASEIKALLHFVAPEINIPGLADYLTFQYVLGEKTMFRDIFRLMPATFLRVRHGEILEKSKYWEIPLETLEDYEEQAVREELASLVRDSVRRQLRSDVPLGAHLSGGIDTATIVSQVRNILPTHEFHTFSAGFPGEGGIYDDTPYAEITANFFHTTHHVIPLGYKDFIDTFQRISYFLDEPVAAPGSFPQFFVSKLASQTVKVVLGGQGADEMFGGYTRYYLYYLESILKECIYGDSEGTGMTLEQIASALPQLQKYRNLMDDYFRDGLFRDRAHMYFRLILRSHPITRYLSADIVEAMNGYSPFEEYEKLFRSGGGGELLNQVLYFEMNAWLPALLQVEDRMSMSWSLESRVPFLERKICELAFRAPAAVKFKGGITKALLRNTFQDYLPSQIVTRRDKIGFPVPLFAWMDHELALEYRGWMPYQRDIFYRPALENIDREHQEHSREVWGLMNVEMWLKNFFDNRVELREKQRESREIAKEKLTDGHSKSYSTAFVE